MPRALGLGVGITNVAALAGGATPALFAPSGPTWDYRGLSAGLVNAWQTTDGRQNLGFFASGNRPTKDADGVDFDGSTDFLYDAARPLTSEASYDLGSNVTCTGLTRAPDDSWWVVAHPLGQAFTDAKLIHYSADFSSVLATLDLGTIYGTGNIGGVQGLVYDTDDDTLWFITGTAGEIFNISIAGVDVPANRIAFTNGNGLAINQADGELIAYEAPGGTNVIRRINKSTGATIASGTLSVSNSDHLFYHEPSKTLCLTSGANGSAGKLTFYAMGQPNFVDEIGSVDIPELDAIEGVYLADGKAWFCNDALSHGVGPANTIEQFDTGDMLGTTVEMYGIANWTVPTPTDCLISVGDPVVVGSGFGVFPRGSNDLRVYAGSFNRTWTGLPSWSTPKILFVRFDKASHTCRLWIDGVEYSTFTDNEPITNITRPFCDRKRLNMAAAYENGSIGRLLASTIKALGYSMVAQDRQKVEGWLAHEFGLTASLPSGHPYKSTAPTTAPVAPTNTTAPAITGSFVEGQTLSVSTGTWTGTPPITYTRQWIRDGSNIAGATGSTYTLTGTNVGTVIACAITATNAAGSATASASGSTVSEASGGSSSLTYTDFAVDPANLAEYTFSAMDIGTASATRRVVVCVALRAGGVRNITGVTVGGVSATEQVLATNTPDGNMSASAIWVADVPTGTSADVVVTLDFSAVRCGVAVYALDGVASSTPDVTASAAGSSTSINPTAASHVVACLFIGQAPAGISTASGNVPAGSLSIAPSSTGAGATAWTNLTEDVDALIEGVDGTYSALTAAAWERVE